MTENEEKHCRHLRTLRRGADRYAVRRYAAYKPGGLPVRADRGRLEHDIHDASVQLADMIDELTGNEYDMAALLELKKVLVNA